MNITNRDGTSKLTLPIPYGAHARSKGVQFTVFSRHASRVWLLLFDRPDAAEPCREIALDPARHRVGDVWHIFVPRLHAGQLYLYRMASDLPGPEGACFHEQQWLLDPCAHAVAGRMRWGEATGALRAGHLRRGAAFPKCVVVDQSFGWGADEAPRISLADSVIYEAHLRGYTVHPSSRVSNPGTYAGLIEKVPYLKRLGITTLELLPVQEFDEMEYAGENSPRGKLRNFWGYSTQAFYAPMSRYASAGGCGDQVREFKKLVRACHKAGIEVLLDVVFNHTNEGNEKGPTWSMRGIDNSIYYMTTDGIHPHNFTGCGNTVNCSHPVVREFILDCLRYWHLVMRVDGFRFDLASIFTRGQQGEPLAHPPLVEAIAEDPSLREAKLIAEAWDAAGLYQVGHFPHRRWSEWNGRFRDDIRDFWNGHHPCLRAFATRFVGSPDLYAHSNQTPVKSINFITCHDGFTMHDLVSYSHKHNEANGEQNRDGENHNRSSNYGEEGPTRNPEINAMRKRQTRNLLATLMLAQGVPMLLAGDEFARTQQGNNNAYCQDNDIAWVDWKGLDKNQDLFNFVRKLIQLRKAQPLLRKRAFLNDQWQGDTPPDVIWSGPRGGEVDWDHGRTIACFLTAKEPHEHTDLFMVFNAGDTPRKYQLPERNGTAWSVALSTQDIPPSCRLHQKTVNVEPRSVTVFRSPRVEPRTMRRAPSTT